MSTPHYFQIVVAGLMLMNVALKADAPAVPGFEQARLAAVPERMRQFVREKQIAGSVTLVATRDRFVQLDAVGQADIGSGAPMKVDSIFWIASMTKPITAAAVLMLQDEGKLSIDDLAAKYLPELAELKGPGGRPAKVTLKQMLTHTSGMVPEAPNRVLRNAKSLADLVPVYAIAPMQLEPGTKWAYCQSGINSLGRIVEVVSGKSLPDFFQERIFEPLGMKDTAFYPSEEQAKRIAKSYRRVGEELQETPVFVLQGHAATDRNRYPAANGGLYSTAADYGRFCQLLLNEGTLDGHRLLRPETVKMMRTIQTGELKTGFSAGNGWGLGVCVVRQPQGVTAMLSPGAFGHGGAYGTQAWIDPVKGVVYVLMVQRADFANSDDSAVRKGFQKAAAAAIQK